MLRARPQTARETGDRLANRTKLVAVARDNDNDDCRGGRTNLLRLPDSYGQ